MSSISSSLSVGVTIDKDKKGNYLPIWHQEEVFSFNQDNYEQKILKEYQNLVTNFLPHHRSNLLALDPINRNSITLFEKNGCDNIPLDRVIFSIKQKIQEGSK